MDQTVINIIVGIAGFLTSSLVVVQWTMIRENQKELQTLRVLVASDFVKQEKFDRVVDAIFHELRTITSIVANKADRP